MKAKQLGLFAVELSLEQQWKAIYKAFRIALENLVKFIFLGILFFIQLGFRFLRELIRPPILRRSIAPGKYEEIQSGALRGISNASVLQIRMKYGN